MRNQKLLDEAERLLLDGRKEEALPILLKLSKMNFEKDRCLMAAATCLVSSDPEQAASLFARIPQHSPLHAVATLNRGICEGILGLEEAAETLKKNLLLTPETHAVHREGKISYSWNRTMVHHALATILQKTGRDAEAIEHLEKALGRLEPGTDPHRIRLDLAYARMREGIFDERSWLLHESRLHKIPGLLDPPANTVDPEGKTVMVYAEQGMGDNIQFARYLRPLRDKARKVVLVTHEPLREIFIPLADEVVTTGEPHPPHDIHLPIMSLPHLLKIGSDIDKWNEPYVRPSSRKIEDWGNRLPPGRKVGIVWKGGKRTTGDEIARKMDRRDLPKEALLAAIPEGFVKISLQIPRESVPGMHDPTGDVRDYHDTAAIISHLEVVVSPDTSVAHLAAAMGKPTLVPSRKDACWRWGKSTGETPWYPNMKIFRQERMLDWNEPLRRLREHLEKI